jgi:hypothetical protein
MRVGSAITVLFLISMAHASSSCDTISKIVDAPFGERAARIRSLYSSAERTIPNLIEEISSSRRSSVILNDPKSSNIEGPPWRYCGVVAAYVIEMLLARSDLSLTPLPQPHGDFFLGISSQDYVYTQGVIRKKNGELIERSDLGKIQALYRHWWQSRKSGTLDDLRKDWQSGSRPLAGSAYHWN